MTQATSGTDAIYTLLMARIKTYVPAQLVLAGQTTPQPLSTVVGGRVWAIRPPDNPQGYPFVVVRLIDRKGDGWDHDLLQAFSLEVQCFNRPYSLAGITQLLRVADQVEVALRDFKESTAPLTIRSMRSRETLPQMATPADRDVCREFMVFDGFMWPYYAAAEVGSS